MNNDGYQQLVVWQKSMLLCELVYGQTHSLPESERYGLASQMRRSAVSVPSNIAEGPSRQSGGEYRHHLQIVRGSVAELETQLLLCSRIGLVAADLRRPLDLCGEISRMLNALIKKLR